MIERNTFIPFDISCDNSIDYLIGILEDARVTTLQRVENLSIEELNWQIDEGCVMYRRSCYSYYIFGKITTTNHI